MEATQNSCLHRAGGIGELHAWGRTEGGASLGPEDRKLGQAAAFHLCGGWDRLVQDPSSQAGSAPETCFFVLAVSR